MKEIIITESTTNQRLDKFLFKLLPTISLTISKTDLKWKNHFTEISHLMIL